MGLARLREPVESPSVVLLATDAVDSRRDGERGEA
jgi:hypothetical protein